MSLKVDRAEASHTGLDAPKRARRGKIPIGEKLAAIDEMIQRREVEIRDLKQRRADMVKATLAAADQMRAAVGHDTVGTLPPDEPA